jgi:hypothetical protein
MSTTALFEEFVDARCSAIELTDRFHALNVDDPNRAQDWDGVVRQTETARLLLEKWLTQNTDSRTDANESTSVPPCKTRLPGWPRRN